MAVIGRGYSQFQQQKANEAKLGAYYTDPLHCKWLHNLFSFSEEEETCVLEPCAGDGVAVKNVTGASSNSHIRIFANEIDVNVAAGLEEAPAFECVLKADFKSEVFITNGAFTFCFGNPPYMTELEFENNRKFGIKAERTEKVFLEKCTNYLKSGGIICWVIPHRIMIEDSYCSFWMSRYETLGMYRFHDSEFAKWGQVAVIGRKRPCSIGVLKDDRAVFQSRIALENLDYVPMQVADEKKISVPVSSTSGVVNFRTQYFDVDAAEAWVRAHPDSFSDLDRAIASRTGIKKYDDTCFYEPPKKLGSQNLALLTACGVGSGYAGSIEERNLHLQRGSVTVTEENSVEETNTMAGRQATLTVRKRSVTNIVLIESDGTITDLVKQTENGREVGREGA